MSYIDVTVPIRSGMPTYRGDPPVNRELVQSLADGATCNVSRLDFGVHSGTHIDAPVHFIDGAPGVEATPLDALIGDVYVVDATAVRHDIDARTLDGLYIPDSCERVVFKTPNSRLWELDAFSGDFIGLEEEAARILVQRGVKLAGIDYLSIAPFGNSRPTHVALLEAGVVILEGLDLRRVEPGLYQIICLPALIEGSDGAPVRTLLRRQA